MGASSRCAPTLVRERAHAPREGDDALCSRCGAASRAFGKALAESAAVVAAAAFDGGGGGIALGWLG